AGPRGSAAGGRDGRAARSATDAAATRRVVEPPGRNRDDEGAAAGPGLVPACRTRTGTRGGILPCRRDTRVAGSRRLARSGRTRLVRTGRRAGADAGRP